MSYSSILNRPWIGRFALLLASSIFLFSLFARLGTPLMWNDEAETAMYGQRILQYGYPKVHDGKNNLYVYDSQNDLRAYDRRTDAYLNTGWLQFYVAAPAVWLAGHVDDPNVQTAILRFPFAILATAAVAILAWVAASYTRRRNLVAAATIAACTLCVPLILHAREVRYYALALLFTSSVLWLVSQHSIHAVLSYRRYVVILVAVLVGTFVTFHPLFFSLLFTLALFAVRHWRRDRRKLVRELLPLGIAGALVIPGMFFFRTFTLSRALNDTFGFDVQEYVQNAGTILIDVASTTFFIPALVATTFALLVWRGAPADHRRAVRLELLLVRFAWLACGVTIGVVSNSVILHQRYYVMLMPLFALVFVLAFKACVALVSAHLVKPRPWVLNAVKSGLLAFLAIPLIASWSHHVGHVREILTPYKGTVDYTVQYIRDHSSNPEDLTIATNYEEHAYMYYLSSRVTIGQALNNIPGDLAYQPDVIIPRQLWMVAAYPYFDAFRKTATYSAVELPIADYYVNNIPELRHPRFTHQFATRVPGDQSPMVIYVRTDRLAP